MRLTISHKQTNFKQAKKARQAIREPFADLQAPKKKFQKI